MEYLSNRQIVLAEELSGRLAERHFAVRVTPVRNRLPDEVLIRVIFAQVPPAARAVMTTTTPFPRTLPGDGIFTAVVGEVVDAPQGGPPPAAIVTCFGGWEQYTLAPVSQVREVPARQRLYEHLGLLGLNGLTAYFGVSSVGRADSGETVVVSAAAGGVGHLAGQIAQIAGARVIGITGSDAKNRLLVNELGFAAAVNRRSDTFTRELRDLCGNGIDVYFDNTGGPVLDTVLPLMAPYGRIVCCGATATYDSADDAVRAPGPRGIPQLVINNRLVIEGLLTSDFLDEWPAALERLARWAAEEQLVALTDLRDGLDAAPAALVAMLAGDNLGQMVVRIGPDPQPS
jgi:NADPH-dependent curcumin reductase CurA